MIDKKQNTSVIEKILKDNFSRASNSEDFNKYISKEPLKLLVIDRIDKNMCYVTDGTHTILTIMANKTEMLNYYPLTHHPN